MSRKAVVLLGIATAVSVLFGAACGGGGASAGDSGKSSGAVAGNAARGKDLFAGTCASCHGADGKGIPGLGKDFTTSTFVKEQSDAQLVEFIKKGRPASDPANTTKVDMPPKGGNPALTDAQIADLVAYIRTLQK